MAEQRRETEQGQQSELSSEGGQQMPIKHRPSSVREGSQLEAVSRASPALTQAWSGSPFSMMRRMMEDMDRMFEDFGMRGLGSMLAPFGREPFGGMVQSSMWSPQIEVAERDGNIVVRADLPGLSKDDVELELREGALILRGERSEHHDERRGDVSYSERRYGSFVRSIPVPEGISPEHVNASFDNGVLEISMRMPASSRRRIAIRSPGERAGTSQVASSSASEQAQQSSGASTAQKGAEGATEATPTTAGRPQPKNGGNQPRS